MKNFIQSLQESIIKSLQNYILIDNIKTPCIVYDMGILKKLVEGFKEEIPKELNYKLYYAVKANANEEIVNFFKDSVDGIDIATLDELEIVRKYFKEDSISINGPAFSLQDCKNLLGKGYSVDINYKEFLGELPLNIPIGIRIAEVDDEKKRLSRFGINIFDKDIENLIKRQRITRIHLHFGEKEEDFLLKLDKIILRLKNLGILSQIKEINIGGGFTKLFIENELKHFFDSLLVIYKKYNIDKVLTIIEPGNALVKHCAFMIVSPVNISYDEEEKQIITINTSIYRNTLWFNPLIITTTNSDNKGKKYTTRILGNTCYENDLYTKEVKLPMLKLSSDIIFYPVGAYVKSNHSNLHSVNFMKELYLWN